MAELFATRLDINHQDLEKKLDNRMAHFEAKAAAADERVGKLQSQLSVLAAAVAASRASRSSSAPAARLSPASAALVKPAASQPSAPVAAVAVAAPPRSAGLGSGPASGSSARPLSGRLPAKRTRR
jgi:hypothetical protein